MTPVGHTLTGLAIGVGVMPRGWSLKSKLTTLAAMLFLANAPDAPLPGWGHDRYDISHSVLVTALAIACCLMLAKYMDRRRNRIPPRVLAGAACAWLSHLLLDTFYNHGQGLAICWPVSDARLALPIPWFATMKLNPLICEHNLRVFGIELMFYGVLLALVTRVRCAGAR